MTGLKVGAGETATHSRHIKAMGGARWNAATGILTVADRAMYAARLSGKGQVMPAESTP
jgi:hypothetical protein